MRFLGLKKTRSAIPPADIRNVFSRKHALEQGWAYRRYITTQSGPTVSTVRIPTQTGQQFRRNLDTDSKANWTPIPTESGQPKVIT